MKSFLQKSVHVTTATFSLPRNLARPARLLVFLFLLGLYFSGTSAGRAQSFAWTVKNSSLAGHGSKEAASTGGDTYVTTAFTGTVTLGGATLKSNGALTSCSSSTTPTAPCNGRGASAARRTNRSAT